MKPDYKRIFSGIPVEEEFQSKLSDYRKQLIKSDNIKWIPQENLHITLQFYSKVSVDKMGILTEHLKYLTSQINPFNLDVIEFDCFPQNKPRMLWAFCEMNEEYDELLKLNSSTSRTNRVPHITIARFHKKHFYVKSTSFRYKIETRIWVKEILLWESFTEPDGAVYHVLERFPLKKL